MKRRKVVIVQEYVPGYRFNFFSGLTDALAKVDIDCRVVAGRPSGDQAARADDSSSAQWLTYAEPIRFGFGKWDLRFYGTTKHWHSADGVVMELKGNSPDLTSELLRRCISRRKVGVWGHVKPFVKPGNSLDLYAENLQMRMCDHIFAYTEAGADFAMQHGVAREKITAVMNSIDTSGVEKEMRLLTPELVREFMQSYGCDKGLVFGFIGGLDSSKRVGFLATALDRIWAQDRRVRVLIGGRGSQESLLAPAIARGQALAMGHVGDYEKAMIMRCSEALVNPGRIGLIAVEALAGATPILTTDWPYHAPEAAYLQEGVSVFTSRDTVENFVQLVLSKRHSAHPSDTAPSMSEYPRLDAMITKFASGVEAMFCG